MIIDKYIQDGQDVKVVEKLVDKLKDMLTSGEQIDYIALQKKPAVTILPDSIAVSSKRIFLCEFTKLGLATNFEIFSWKDIKDIAFKEEIFGSKVTVIPFTGENLSIDYIPKIQARKLYQLIKGALENSKKEELQSEKEKIVISTPVAPVIEVKKEETPAPAEPKSFNEEVPAEPAAPVVNSYVAPSYTPPAPEPLAPVEEEDEITQKLKKLKSLFDKQLITQAEYENKKNELLSQL
ncbi:PH domain-containing protein [Sphingobacterium spiritivorum]|uniref:PH domain-containing protein n=1 Tax=Sphingobacterium spiritivorum TaxID=258 RepID=UPI0019194E4D|nr:PH domain-containing protein [Sphingobacterium spiritivorum]QQT24357.1 PH domain-containing protein [Sphingobacterium spiritivorum]